LAKYDGNNLIVFSHPTGGIEYVNIPPYVYRGSLYFGYRTLQGYNLTKLSDTITIKLCSGSNAFLTSSVSGANYNWQLNTGSGFVNITDNANYSGTNTISLQINNAPSNWTNYQYRCVVGSRFSEVFKLQFENQWTGSVSSAWENPLNWSCGILPDSNTNVIINSGIVTINSNVIVSTLSLAPGVSITVNTGFNLIVLH